ncbi:MAG: T9SS type A sorting domain-containing protein, partial [Bacteroidota bacterium]
MVWMVYNDSAYPDYPVGADFQFTAWTYQCEEAPTINRTLFTSHKVINRSGMHYDTIRMALWADASVGCPYDDLAGSLPAQDAIYYYNSDVEDGLDANCNCNLNGPFQTYCEAPPAFSIQWLNQPMRSSIFYFEPFWGFPAQQGGPYNDLGAFHLMNAQWIDGTPLREGGLGGSDVSNQARVYHAFPDLPSDTAGWSMWQEGIAGTFLWAVMATQFEDWKIGEAIQLDVAYTIHYDEQVDHLGQVANIRPNVEQIKQWYEEGFQDDCFKFKNENTCDETLFCTQDCIWPGDANKDGIANHLDLLHIGAAAFPDGPCKLVPNSWLSYQVGDWPYALIDGTNLKHIDCNGDGMVDLLDFEVTKNYYGRKALDGSYNFNPTYTAGTELEMQLIPSLIMDTISLEAGDVITISLSNLHLSAEQSGVGFSLEYDSSLFELLLASVGEDWDQALNTTDIHSYLSEAYSVNGRSYVDFSAYDFSALPELPRGFMVSFVLQVRRQLAAASSWESPIRLANTKGIRPFGTDVPVGCNTIIAKISTLSTAVESMLTEKLLVYPNPAHDRLLVKNLDQAITQITLYDVHGRVMKRPITDNSGQKEVDLSHIPKGCYWLDIRTKRDRWVEKITIIGKH